MKSDKTASDFFGNMLIKYFENIDDSYDLNTFLEFKYQDKIAKSLDSIGVKCELVLSEHQHTIVKFTAFDIDVFVKFDKIENSHESLVYDNDVCIVIPKEKTVIYFD